MFGEIWLVGLGGFLGAIARYKVGLYFSSYNLFPIGTFFVNLTGSFFMGILFGSNEISDSLRVLIGSGFLGAYTTFSTFNYELLMLKRGQRVFQFYLYLFLSYLLGIIFAFIGFSISND